MQCTLGNLEPVTEYSYRLCFVTQDNVKSEYSQPCNVKTTSEINWYFDSFV